MLPLVRELEKRPETESIVCVTAQHRQLLDCVLRCFELEPDYDLDIMTEGQSLYSVTAKVLTGMEGCLAQASPTSCSSTATPQRRLPPPSPHFTQKFP